MITRFQDRITDAQISGVIAALPGDIVAIDARKAILNHAGGGCPEEVMRELSDATGQAWVLEINEIDDFEMMNSGEVYKLKEDGWCFMGRLTV